MDNDRIAIEQLVVDIARGFNAHDAAAMTAPFSADAQSAEADGQVLVGRTAITDAYRTGFAGDLAEQYARLTVRDITFGDRDHAVATVDVTAADADGRTRDIDHTMNASYVVVRRDGRWWVTARTHTLVRKDDLG